MKKNNKIKSIIFGLIMLGISIFLIISFFLFIYQFTNNEYQLNILFKTEITIKNLVGKIGYMISYYLIYCGIGICAIFIPILLFIIGLQILLKKNTIFYKKIIYNCIFFSMCIYLFYYYIYPNKIGIINGSLGLKIVNIFIYFFGKIGSFIVVFISIIIYALVIYSNIKKKYNIKKIQFYYNLIIKILNNYIETIILEKSNNIESNSSNLLEKRLVKKTLYPVIGLESNAIADIKPENIEFFIKSNKKKIKEIFDYYKIKILKINATVGPSITLYEIIPHIGVRLYKIKNLEKEIALNLSAKSIRIIAPIPGKGSIGIEIPNNKHYLININEILFSKESKEKSFNKELPILLGKTVFNEIFIVDLTEMPHLLIAGATGQGKSVELNVIIIFLLYRKKPEDIKFILIDPKKVELSIYKKISDYYFATIPNFKGNEIITSLQEVHDILNSLCKEMDKRYSILEKYQVRNIKEYNKKKCKYSKKLHLPYIILIIDEFADLCLSSNYKKKSIEKYIIRLAQLARAVGIHLIIATQRPSVDVISGLIKSNFSSRIAFKVSSKIDSRTILDCSGAEKLIGNGDLLFYNKNEIIRLQCPFIDSSDIKKIVNYYGNKFSKKNKYFLPNP
ncbi:DNA translocase FtsK 4TM domain-containing protein [Blattabacterium cuenoti]|uniref:DNA translocase FtsK 4TM domain-containing protein n=1 Tax=Blattabacterium cuenoti TaxID=1653831 RepID=UPI00163D3C64|nr:DNA translocase FtsK 4TM domain-containing protein [Blattabacterium cuenoti]